MCEVSPMQCCRSGARLFLLLSAIVAGGCSRGGLPGLMDVPDGAGPGPGLDLGGADGPARDLMPAPDLTRPTPSARVAFGAAATYPVDTLAFHLTAGRFDRDAGLDLVAGGSSDLSLYRNDGRGGFTAARAMLGVGGSWQLQSGDLNGDGVDDLAITDPSRSRIVVALARGDGTFAPGVGYPAGMTPQSVTALDLNGDGALDLVAGSYGTNQLHVFLNNKRGDGTFTAGASYAVASSPIWLTPLDQNGDGKMDLVATSYSGGAISVFLGNGDGTLQAGRVVAMPPGAVMTAVGDFDLDGIADLATLRESVQGVAILQGQRDGSFQAGATLTVTANSGQSVRAADLNGDGIVDLVAACAGTSQARVFLGRGDGTFGDEQLFPGGGSNVFDALPVDVNGDGLMDLALSEGNAGKISVLLNTTPR